MSTVAAAHGRRLCPTFATTYATTGHPENTPVSSTNAVTAASLGFISQSDVVHPIVVGSAAAAAGPTIADFQSPYAELQDWNWRFGKTPDFAWHLETRFEWGTLDVHVHAEHGFMTKAVVFSDCLYPVLIDSIQTRLVGASFSADGVRDAMRAVRQDMIQAGLDSTVATMIAQFETWLTQEIK